MFRKRKAQAIMEYIIVLAALVAAFTAASGAIGGAMNNSLSGVAGKAENAVSEIDLSLN